MFLNEENHKKKAKTKLKKDIISIYEGYFNAEEFMMYCSIERDRRVIEQRLSDSKKVGHREGKMRTLKGVAYTKYEFII